MKMTSDQSVLIDEPVEFSLASDRRLYWVLKRGFDLGVSVLLLGPLVIFAAVLLILNPVFNKGPLFYVQTRMGRDCRPFATLKFRSMRVATPADGPARGHDDPIEHHRITALGGLLRKTRIDELPQILSVLKGDMSLIGPRPDTYSHAMVFCRTVPGYAARHVVRPGISGLAQVTQGYAVGVEATRVKTALDLRYVRSAGYWMDLSIVVKTIICVILRRGA